MVMLYKSDETNYAIFGVYLRDYFPVQVLQKKQVMDAFYKWGSFSTNSPAGFLVVYYGTLPTVRVTDFNCTLVNDHYRTRYGLAPDDSQIWINTKLVKQVESVRALKHPSFGAPTADDQRIFTMIESVIMAQLVHWTRNWLETESQINDHWQETENRADSFLKDAYGGSLAPAFADLCP